MNTDICPNCGGNEFSQGTDYMPIKPLEKKFINGSYKIYTFCTDCGEVTSIRVENPNKFKK